MGRSGEKVDCGGRLREILWYYFGDRYEAEFAEEPGNKNIRRIIPIAGDIESDPLAENMPEDVQTVIHTAASVVVVLFEGNDVGITLSRVFKVKFKSSDRNIIVVVKDRKL